MAERLGEEYKSRTGKSGGETSVGEVCDFLKGMEANNWERICPKTTTLSGSDYEHVWELLAGEGR